VVEKIGGTSIGSPWAKGHCSAAPAARETEPGIEKGIAVARP
jgi:hypothetical protein